MKKLYLLESGAILVGLMIATASADGLNNFQINGPNVQDDAAPQSAVSQTRKDTVIKREEAKKQRDKKLKIRARNLKKSPIANGDLLKPAQ